MVIHPTGISESILAQFRAVLAKFPAVEQAVVYGSRARGDFQNGSDIDLAVIGQALTPSDFAQLCWQLEDVPQLFKLDIVHFDKIQRPALQNAIRQSQHAIYTRI